MEFVTYVIIMVFAGAVFKSFHVHGAELFLLLGICSYLSALGTYGSRFCRIALAGALFWFMMFGALIVGVVS